MVGLFFHRLSTKYFSFFYYLWFQLLAFRRASAWISRASAIKLEPSCGIQDSAINGKKAREPNMSLPRSGVIMMRKKAMVAPPLDMNVASFCDPLGTAFISFCRNSWAHTRWQHRIRVIWEELRPQPPEPPGLGHRTHTHIRARVRLLKGPSISSLICDSTWHHGSQ